MNKIKLAPSKARILNMDYPMLIEHHSLIELKKSSLSSSQRKMVINRIKYLLGKNKITQPELDKSITNLKQYL